MATRDPEYFPGDIVLKGATSGQLRVQAAASTTSHTITYPAAQGSASQVLQNDGSGGLSRATASAGAVTREGGNTTEATTTSTSDVDLLSQSSLTIAVGVPVYATAIVRKSTGAADEARAGLGLNSTEVVDPAQGDGRWSTATDRVESALWEARFIYGVTSYLDAGYARATSIGQAIFDHSFGANDMPTAELTDIHLRARVDNASITMGADEGHTFIFAVS